MTLIIGVVAEIGRSAEGLRMSDAVQSVNQLKTIVGRIVNVQI